MLMKKLSEDHYIIVNDNFDPIDSDRKYVHKSGRIWQWDSGMAYVSNNPPQPITHSTQPEFLGTGWMQSIQPLFLSEVKELLGVVDVEKKSYAFIKEIGGTRQERLAYIDGYREALEDNKEKKYTEEDMRKAMRFGSMRNKLTISELESSFQQLIQSLQPKTEWEVEFVNGKLKLKS